MQGRTIGVAEPAQDRKREWKFECRFPPVMPVMLRTRFATFVDTPNLRNEVSVGLRCFKSAKTGLREVDNH
jgi:hypothetical protein